MINFLIKKLQLKKVIFFFKAKNDETISIFPISKLNLFYNEKKMINEIIAQGKNI